MVIYSNSCSFGAPQDHLTYGDYFAAHYGAKLINNGMPSSCNRRIIRTSIRDLSGILESDKDPVALIGLTFVSRTELWQPDLPASKDDGHFHPLNGDSKQIDWSAKGLTNTHIPDIHKYARGPVQNYYKEWLIHYHPESAVTDIVTDLLMFAGWARSNKIRYLIFSNVDLFPGPDQIDCGSPFLKSLVEALLSDESVIDPWTFSFGTYARELGFQPKDAHLFGTHGHPGHESHKKFSEFLISKFKQNYQS